MGGSRPDVVAAADELTGPIDQDGLADVINSLFPVEGSSFTRITRL
jgi:hypothetical protein